MKRLLVVDDHDENLYLTQTLLESQGFAVQLAHNGAEALEKAREAPPDLVISDLLMPLMDGFTLCRKWKADERLKSIPFVFHTATYTDQKDEQLALAVGADAFITKPIDPEDFVAAIVGVLARGEAASATLPKEIEIADGDFAKEHSEAMVRIVELKMQQAEKANRDLQQEIAERKRAEESLQESEARFRGLFETMSQGAIYHDADGVIVLANPAAASILGLPPDEMQGRTLWDPRWAATREDGSDFTYDQRPAIVSLRTGQPLHGVIMCVHSYASGEPRWLSVDAMPQFLPGATTPSGVFSTFTDITERKLAEDGLRRQLSFDELLGGFLSCIANASPADTGDCIAAVLQPVADFVGVDSVIVFQVSDDLASWGATYSWAEPSIATVATRLTNVSMGTLPWVEERILADKTVVLRSLDDLSPEAQGLRQLWEAQNLKSALLVPLHGRGALVRGCLALFSIAQELSWEQQDVRRVEQLGEAIAAALERKRVEDSLRASDEQLRQSQKMEAVGQLAGGIAHDFNNLLTAIIGYSDLLLASQELPSSAARKDAEEIRAAAERASALTRQILAFSRRQTLRPTVMSLNDILVEMEPLLRHTLGEDIDLISHPDPELGHVEVDVHQFEQVLMNLALNARDAMSSGGQLTLETSNVLLDEEYRRTHPWVTPGSYVMMTVSDTGIGMDEATRARIFEPFFTTKEMGKGTGLGLSTVYGIVKQSGGSISVSSEPSNGTTFRIYLPRTAAPKQAEITATPGETSAEGNETILVVEDEGTLRGLVSRVLGSLGYTAHIVGSAEEAIPFLEDAEQHLDLLLTDIVLPGSIQGDSLAEQARDLRPGLPVVYMSGYAHDAVKSPGRLDSGVNYLEKPFGSDELGRRVREVLDAAEA